MILLTITSISATVTTSIYSISAKEMIMDRKSGITVFKGEAKIIEVEETTKKPKQNGNYIYADQVSVYRDPETNEVIKMEAIGNVVMRQGDLNATCAHAVLYEAEDRIDMDGSPAKVDDGKNNIEAPSIIYYRKENRLEAKGSVSGFITIEEKEETD